VRAGISHTRRFLAAIIHARAYAHTSEQLVRELGEHLLWHREPPALFRKAMGDEMFLIRHGSLDEMHAAVRRIQQQS
jgi:hypothetical protein